MVESETYRFQDVCSRELLVKILSEEVCFQAGFEGRGGKAVTKNEGKRTADLCSREAEGTTTMHAIPMSLSELAYFVCIAQLLSVFTYA